MSGACMYFEKNWKEFLESYSFVDQKEIYTNGARLIQTLRVKQMVDHYFKNANTQQWISCSERLPKENQIVMCSVKKEYASHRIVLQRFDDKEYWHNGTIEAWMPLPEPYREGDV